MKREQERKTGVWASVLGVVLGAGLALALSLSYAPEIRASMSDWLRTGGGEWNVQALQLAGKNGSGDQEVSVNTNTWQYSVLSWEGNENAIFRLAGSALFDNIVSIGQTRFDRLAVGYSPFYGDFFREGTVDEAELSVKGAIAIRDFADPNAAGARYLCADDFGKLVVSDQEDCGSSGSGTGGSGGGGGSTGNPVNGMCKTYQGTYSSQPATDTNSGCSLGTYQDAADTTTEWKWNCLGVNGGSDASCTAGKDSGSGSVAVNAKCKTYDRTYPTQPATDTASGCTSGTYQDASDSSIAWYWNCLGVNGGSDASCTAKKETRVAKSYVCAEGVWNLDSSKCDPIEYDDRYNYEKGDVICTDDTRFDGSNDPDGNCNG